MKKKTIKMIKFQIHLLAAVLGINFIFCLDIQAQSCYIRLTDASGLTPSQYQLDLLENESCRLIDSLPEVFQDSFKVFDFGFYLNNEFTSGGFPETFRDALDKVRAQNKYYLLFGKQTDQIGVYSKFWIELNLPAYGQFACVSELQRKIYSKRVEKATVDKYYEKNKFYSSFYEAEIAGIEELQNIIKEIKECCVAGRGVILEECENCTSEMVDHYFNLNGFKNFEIIVSSSMFSNINTFNIKDFSSHKYNIDNKLDYTGVHLSDMVTGINEKISFNLLITSDLYLCENSIGELEEFIQQSELSCWINFSSTVQESTHTFIKVYWNQDKSVWIGNPKLAELIIKDIYCQIFFELELDYEECNFIQPPPSCVYDIPIRESELTGGLTISEFIDLLRLEEAKYSFEEQEDTKAMITRFRKLFYGSPGWDFYLIPGAANNTCIKPYIIENQLNSPPNYVANIFNLPNLSSDDFFLMYDIGYFPVDPETRERPLINAVTVPGPLLPQTQEVKLEMGSHAGRFVDVGHVFCGMDAFFNSSEVRAEFGPFPTPLHINRNIDAVTWLGDLASAQAEIQFKWSNNGGYSIYSEIQNQINVFASGPDMLGDIDGIVIGLYYCNDNNPSLKKVSDIFYHYYLGEGVVNIQEKRYSRFSQNLGLIWYSGLGKFINMKEKINYFNDQVNDAAALYTMAGAQTGGSQNLPGAAVFSIFLSVNNFSKKLLKCFFEKLENNILSEP